MQVSLFLDIEDCITPCSDDIARDLAGILTRHGVVANGMVVGDKARTLERRGRADVIEALKPHEIGLHTDRHSRHPNVSEYLAQMGWEDGVAEASRREAPGVDALNRVFGKPPFGWAQSGGSWGPQIHPAVRQLGLGCVAYPETHTATCGVHWYGGTLTFGWPSFVDGFDTAYSDDDAFERALAAARGKLDAHRTAGAPWVGLFACHPIYVRAYEFGDALNYDHGRQTPPDKWRQPELKTDAEYSVALRNFERLVRWLVEDPDIEVAPMSAAAARVAAPPEHVDRPGLEAYASEAAQSEDILTECDRLSPAAALELMCRAVGERHDTAALPLREVAGPIEEVEPPAAEVDGEALPAACAFVAGHVERTNRLCNEVPVGGRPVGLGSFYRALCRAFPRLLAGEAPGRVRFDAGRQVPALADVIAESTQHGFREWVIHPPDLDTSRLIALTRCQTWTLRPAVLSR